MKQAAYIIVIILALLFGSSWLSKMLASRGSSDIVSKEGIHWHSRLDIYLRGEKVTIPANIGVPPGSSGHPANLHTHEEDNIVHMEFPGIVRRSRLKIGDFFNVWGKRFDKECVLDLCATGTSTIRMMVNGKENTEFENYSMKDNDEIEIRFE